MEITGELRKLGLCFSKLSASLSLRSTGEKSLHDSVYSYLFSFNLLFSQLEIQVQQTTCVSSRLQVTSRLSPSSHAVCIALTTVSPGWFLHAFPGLAFISPPAGSHLWLPHTTVFLISWGSNCNHYVKCVSPHQNLSMKSKFERFLE